MVEFRVQTSGSSGESDIESEIESGNRNRTLAEQQYITTHSSETVRFPLRKELFAVGVDDAMVMDIYRIHCNASFFA